MQLDSKKPNFLKQKAKVILETADNISKKQNRTERHIMETEIKTGITKEELQAIKKADRIVFRINQDGNSVAWAAKNNPKSNEPFEEYDFRFDIQVAKAKVTDYSKSDVMSPNEFSCIVERDALELLKHIVRAGDTLQGHWMLANNNEHVKDSGLTTNEFRVIIKKKTKNLSILVRSTTRTSGRYSGMI